MDSDKKLEDKRRDYFMDGQYSEKLKSGGDLVITLRGWYIKYYFSGPDLRYNGTFVNVDGKHIDSYIDAWRKNFEKFLKVKESIPLGGKFETTGEMGMSIRIGWSEGVCLKYYHMPINTKEKLEQVISDYEYAKERARRITSLLQQMNDGSFETTSLTKEEKVSEEEKCLNDCIDDNDWSEIFEYQKKQDGIVISRYIGFDEEKIVVPDTIENMEVVEIGDGAFQNCKSIKRVTLPTQLRKIGRKAFAYCEELKTIDIPKRCEKIGQQAFEEIGIAGANLANKAQINIRIGNNVRLIEDENNKIHSVFGFIFNRNITIYCNAGSYAMEYARKYKISVRRYEEFEEVD